MKHLISRRNFLKAAGVTTAAAAMAVGAPAASACWTGEKSEVTILYTNDVQGLTRLFIPIGYAGFDILVWTLIAFYGKTTPAAPLRIVAVAMGAEQAGILGGQLIGIALGGSANAANNVVLMVLSYLLLLAVMGLARLCTVLWRRQRTGEAEAAVEAKPDADEPDDHGHLDRFADAYGLTNRERDIFALFAEGRSAPYIAEMLVLSENTVKTHLRHAYAKMDVHSRQELLDLIEETSAAKKS